MILTQEILDEFYTLCLFKFGAPDTTFMYPNYNEFYKFRDELYPDYDIATRDIDDNEFMCLDRPGFYMWYMAKIEKSDGSQNR